MQYVMLPPPSDTKKYVITVVISVVLSVVCVYLGILFTTEEATPPIVAPEKKAAAYDGRNANEIGMVAYYAANKPPPNWLECNGDTYVISSYPALFKVIGDTYDYGKERDNPFDTFVVPDLRGQFIRGFDPTGTVDVDRARGGFGSLQGHMFQSHAHGGVMRHPGGQVEQDQEGRPEGPKTDYNRNTDASGGSETRPRNVALLPCIRYQ